MKVLRLFSRISPTSSPYVQFTKGFKTVESLPLPYAREGEDVQKGLRAYFRYLHRCRQHLRNIPDLTAMHCHNAYLLPAALLAKWSVWSRVPLVFTLHTSYPLLKLRNKAILWSAFLFLDSLVACGRSVRGTLPNLLSRSSKTVAIRNAVDLDRLGSRLALADPGHRKARPAGLVFYMASRLVAGKNIDQLLSVFETLQTALPEARLNLFGDGPLRDVIAAKARGKTAVTLWGQVDRDSLYTAIADQDVYISLSAGEGLPIAPLEALAAGLYAVLSDIPPHRELYALFPERVFLVDCNLSNLDSVIVALQAAPLPQVEITDQVQGLLGLDQMEREYKNVYQQGSAKIETIFTEKAQDYEQHYNSNQNRYSVEKARRLDRTVEAISQGSQSGCDVIDVGCGTGILFTRLCEVSDHFAYVGVDTSPGMLEVAKTNAKASVSGQTSAFYETLEAVPVQGFNFVVSLGVVGYQSDQAAFLRELSGLLKRNPNSRMILTLGNGESWIRRARDFAHRRLLRNDSAYTAAPDHILRTFYQEEGLEVVEERMLLPFFSALPSENTAPRSLSGHLFYLTRFLVLRPSRN